MVETNIIMPDDDTSDKLDPKPDNDPDSNLGDASAQPQKNVAKNHEVEDDTSRAKRDDESYGDILKDIRDILRSKINGGKYYFFGNNIYGSAFGVGASVSYPGNSPKDYSSENAKPTESAATDWLEWFRHKKIQEQVFVVTLVFFSGNSPKFVESAALDFLKFIGVSMEAPKLSSSIFDSGVSINNFLQDGFAKIRKSSLGTEAGKLPFDAIVVEDESALQTIQETITRNYDLVSFRLGLRKWLSSMSKYDDSKLRLLGASSPNLTRVQSALSLGVLAKSDFDDVLSSVIRPWAGSESLNERLMVGWVLLGYFEETNQIAYWSKASALLKHWSTIDNYYLRWTAIASTTRLGLIVSPEDDASLELSMSIFKQTCLSGRPRLHWGVMLKSLRFLFGLSLYHAKIICMELSSWLKEDNVVLQDIASSLFVEMLNVAVSDSETEVTLWDMCEQESYVVSDAVYVLTRQALISQSGSFVDHAVKQMSKSVQTFLDDSLHACNSLKEVVAQLRSDKQTAKYVPLILGDYQKRI